MIDSWILMDKAALNTLWSNRVGTLFQQAIRGYWKDSGSYEVVNVLASEAELDQFMTDHAADVLIRYDWIQGPGYDAQETSGQTVPQGVLDVMKDHIEYDEDGNVISTTPPDFDTPNWGHVFLGQSTRIFAGDFSTDDFNEDFR